MSRKLNPQTQCQHRTKDRKRCQMPTGELSQLCLHHQRTAANEIYQSIESRRPEKDPAQIAALATALLTNTNNLSDPAQVNQFLANLLNQLAHNNISRKNAIAMAYISQLLLNSISVKHRQARDAQTDKLEAESRAPKRIVIDMPRPQHPNPGSHTNATPSTNAASPTNAQTSTDATPSTTHSTNVPRPTNPARPTNVSPSTNVPPSTNVSPSTNPAPPNSTEQPRRTESIDRPPQRPNTYGPPRMRNANLSPQLSQRLSLQLSRHLSLQSSPQSSLQLYSHRYSCRRSYHNALSPRQSPRSFAEAIRKDSPISDRIAFARRAPRKTFRRLRRIAAYPFVK
jgi:hypothetical protein